MNDYYAKPWDAYTEKRKVPVFVKYLFVFVLGFALGYWLRG